MIFIVITISIVFKVTTKGIIIDELRSQVSLCLPHKGHRNIDKYGRAVLFQDPYCILTLGKERYRSRTARGAGKKPVWFHTFKFDTLETILKVTMMDEDTIVDDLIG